MNDSITRHTPYPLTSADRHRLLIALAISAVVVWAATAVPVAQWMLTTAAGASTDPDRVAAADAVASQGWWAVILVVFGVGIGSIASVASRYLTGANWTITALTCAGRMLVVLVACWTLWTVCTLAAAGAQTI